jgi:hypothetical protein
MVAPYLSIYNISGMGYDVLDHHRFYDEYRFIITIYVIS